MSNATLDYFEEYRDKIAELYRLNQQLEILEQEQQKKLSNIRVISGEIEGMRKIISIMIDKGWDPVGAKLRIEGDHRQNTLWPTMGFDAQVLRNPNGLVTTNQQHSKLSTVLNSMTCYSSANGATGASGAANNYTYSYPAGSNGAIGYNGTK